MGLLVQEREVFGILLHYGIRFFKASANAKMVNLSTNFGSICLFMLKGKIIWRLPFQWLLAMLLAVGLSQTGHQRK
jgi:hypothetical protein